MPRYYESESLIDFVKNYTPHINGETTMECVERAIRNAPTVDVDPKTEGEWVVTENGCVITCSECSYRLELCYPDGTEVRSLPACPICGRKMKGKETTKKHFSPEEVHKMTPKEVRENLAAIMNSMKKWK